MATLTGFVVSANVFYDQSVNQAVVNVLGVRDSTNPALIPNPQVIQNTLNPSDSMEALLENLSISSVWPFNPLKYAIQGAYTSGVKVETIVLLLLLPVIATLIAAARHLLGIRGFGIFMPAALAVVFVATGPIVGIGLFLVIIFVSTSVRFVLRKLDIKLQPLPRQALILLFIVLGVLAMLFVLPEESRSELINASIFPILILVLLAEDFMKIQLGKSAKTAVNITSETLILALISYVFLTLEALQRFALLNPELLLVSVAIINFIVGKYVGLRAKEYWRFRSIINK